MFDKIKELFSSSLEINTGTVIFLVVAFIATIVGFIFFIKLLKKEFRHGAETGFYPFNFLAEILFIAPLALVMANSAFKFAVSPIILTAALVVGIGAGIWLNIANAGVLHGMLYTLLDLVAAAIFAALIVESLILGLVIIIVALLSLSMWTSGHDVYATDISGQRVKLFYNENTGSYTDGTGRRYYKGSDGKIYPYD